MSVLMGAILDVSGSMRRYVKRDSRQEKWVTSVFRIAKDIAVENASVFLFCVGAKDGENGKSFDLLVSLKCADPVTNVMRTKAMEKYRDNTAEWLSERILRKLESQGAPNVANWASVRMVSEELGQESAAFMLLAVEENPEFLQEVVEKCLPSVCKFVPGVLASGLKAAVPEMATRFEVRRAIRQSKRTWKRLHAPVEGEAAINLIEIEPKSAVFSTTEALDLLSNEVLDEEEKMTDKQVDDLLKKVEPYIYGHTPLIDGMIKTSETFSAHSDFDEKVLFILSDGRPSDAKQRVDEILEFERVVKNLGVTVVSCYITDKHIPAKRLYCVQQDDWDKYAKFLFHASSSVTTQNIPKTLFVKRDWTIDFVNNETKLFLQVNHPDLLDDVTPLVTNVASSRDALSAVIREVSLDVLINANVRDFKAKEQEPKMCWATAAAAGMILAMRRIYKREGGYPYFEDQEDKNFEQLRDHLVEKYKEKHRVSGTTEAVCTASVLEEACPEFRLKCRKLEPSVFGTIGALRAVSSNRPVVATFAMSHSKWLASRNFFEKNPKGILTKEVFDNVKEKDGEKITGHAVIFTSYNAKAHTFMNSWGTEWGDGGFFHVARSQSPPVIKMQYIDIYFDEDDLRESEKAANLDKDGYWKNTMKMLRSLELLKSARHVCPHCRCESSVLDYKTTDDGPTTVECPRCSGCFMPRKNFITLCLYLKSLAEGG